jgi:alpha-beta hydrolase superfamily lysophospholipase
MPGSSVTRSSIVVARALSAVLPKMGVALIDASGISRDQSVVDAYISDPLVYRGKIRARLGAELIDTIERSLPSKMAVIEDPVLLVHGTEDRLSNTEGSSLLYKSVKSKDKTLKYYKGFYHETLNEPGRAEVLSDIAAWLEDHIRPR